MPFASFDVIAVALGQKLAAIIFALTILDEHQHKLNDTDHKTRDPVDAGGTRRTFRSVKPDTAGRNLRNKKENRRVPAALKESLVVFLMYYKLYCL